MERNSSAFSNFLKRPPIRSNGYVVPIRYVVRYRTSTTRSFLLTRETISSITIRNDVPQGLINEHVPSDTYIIITLKTTITTGTCHCIRNDWKIIFFESNTRRWRTETAHRQPTGGPTDWELTETKVRQKQKILNIYSFCQKKYSTDVSFLVNEQHQHTRPLRSHWKSNSRTETSWNSKMLIVIIWPQSSSCIWTHPRLTTRNHFRTSYLLFYNKRCSRSKFVHVTTVIIIRNM